nr:hypothetical protein [uncultured Flavobacterium sp.]
MKYKIDNITKTEYNEVVNIWEASVRATHHFLKEEDIQYFKSLVYEPFFSRI